MYYSLILSISLLPILGLAVPTTTANGAPFLHNSRDTPRRSALLNITDITNVLVTVNGFTDPEVHCSGRKLSDSGTTDYTSALNAAVTGSSDDSLYGACNVDGSDVNGDGSLAFISGKVQVYYCNHGFSAISCSVNEYWRADDLITDSCGADGGGWVTLSSSSRTIGRDPANSDGSFRSECGDSLHGVNENWVVTNATRAR